MLNSHVSYVRYCYIQDIVIQEDDEIRVKIVGIRVDASDIVSTV